MDAPVLVEVMRGGYVESTHRGAFAVVDAAGRVLLSAGGIDHPIFPRSAVKVLQALPLIESGAAASFGFDAAEIALACASHSGEEAHVAIAQSMLNKAGLPTTCLACGAHWPMGERATRELAAHQQEPSVLHNNCSGKHAGMVCVALQQGWELAGYTQRHHPMMQAVEAVITDVAGVDLAELPWGIDGCSLPTYALPLRNIAHAFAKIASGVGLAPERASAAKKLRKAVAQAPFMVAGTGRFDSDLMALTGERVFIKMGAEGVYTAALPEAGLGIALKIEDGAIRAGEALMAGLLTHFLQPEGALAAFLRGAMDSTLRNWNKIEVGSIRVLDIHQPR